MASGWDDLVDDEGEAGEATGTGDTGPDRGAKRIKLGSGVCGVCMKRPEDRNVRLKRFKHHVKFTVAQPFIRNPDNNGDG